MEIAESARDQSVSSISFAGDLFMGNYDPSLLSPFPQQSEDDRKIGDELVSQVSSFLAENLDADEVDESRTIPSDVMQGLRDLGVFRMKVPKEYGGLGLSQVNYNRVVMAIASHCGSTAVLVSAHQSIGVPQPLKMFGTDAQKEKYLRQVSKGSLTAFALTEPDAGSDPAKMTTTAVKSEDGKHYIINGTKLWATNGPIADLLVVMAATAPKVYRGKERTQITAFIVEMDLPGIEVTHRCDFMGLRAIHNGVITFDNVKIPVENIIWGEGKGLKLALKTLNTGRLTLPAACTGMGKQCLSIVRRWGQDRVQWGMPIGRHEAGSQKIAYITATTFAMEALTWLTSHWAEDQDKNIRIEAAMAKLFCSEAAWEIVDQTMQIRAGRGYEKATSLRARGEDAYPVERMMRDCRINTIIEGTSDIMRLFLAREVLDPHLKRAAGMMDPRLSLKERLSEAPKILGFYAKWYVQRIFGCVSPMRFSDKGQLAKHHRFINRASNRLATKMFHAMARHQQKLERKQVLLGQLIDIGTELFTMSVTCAYAESLATNKNKRGDAYQLAEEFCKQARKRISQQFRSLSHNNQASALALTKDVLDGKVKWMEDGIIPIDNAA